MPQGYLADDCYPDIRRSQSVMASHGTVEHTRRLVPVSTSSNGHDLELIVHTLTGDRPGPTLGLLGGTHGDEPLTVEFVRVLLADLEQASFAGTVIAITCANPLAFRTLTRCTPDDMVNISSAYPGNSNGLLTEQLADAIFKVFDGACQAYIEFHCGGILPTVDYVYMYTNEAMARAVGSKVLFARSIPANPVGLAEHLNQKGVHAALVELGGGQVDQRPYVERIRRGIPNVLRMLGMLEGEVEHREDQVVVTELATLRPHNGGLLISSMEVSHLGDIVEGGHELGRILHTLSLEELETLRAPFKRSVMVLARQGFSPINAGDYAFMFGNAE
jgi:predicted deacylase